MSVKVEEARLRHPWEQPIFIASVVLNVGIMLGAFLLLRTAHDWLADHPLAEKGVKYVTGLAAALAFAPPAIVLIRNARLGLVRGNAVRLSRIQIPQIYGILEEHCRRLELDQVPALYLSDEAIDEPAKAFSVWKHDYIVLTPEFLERDPERVRDVLSFLLGRELGRIRLGHTTWWYELVLAYVIRIPYLRNPMTHIQTLSHDRYGAYLAPHGIRGLAVQACGRRILSQLNLPDFVRQVHEHGGFWTILSSIHETRPHVSYRIRALLDAGLLQTGRAEDRTEVSASTA